MMTADRESVLKSFLETVALISDKAHQERTWVKGEGPECYDMDEAYNDFFDLGEPIIDEYIKYKLTEVQYKLVVKLRDKLNKFDNIYTCPKDYKSEEEHINLPMWQEIRDLAKKVCKSFNYERKPFIE